MNRRQRRAWKHRKKTGAMITIEIDFKHTQGKETVVETRTFPLDIDDLPLTLCEALEQEGIGQLRVGITEYLGLTEEESKQLRLKHVKQIAAAIREASTVPNG